MTRRSPALPKILSLGDLVDRFEGLLAIVTDDHALAGRQPVGLDDDGRVFPIVQVANGVAGVLKGPVVGAGHVGAAEQVAAEDLAGLQLGRRLGRSEDFEPFRLEGVDNPGRQRRFRPDNRQAHVVLPGELHQGRKIVGRNVNILGILGRAGVSRGHENTIHSRTLGDFPCQGVFPPPAADDQNVHCAFFPRMRVCLFRIDFRGLAPFSEVLGRVMEQHNRPSGEWLTWVDRVGITRWRQRKPPLILILLVILIAFPDERLVKTVHLTSPVF